MAKKFGTEPLRLPDDEILEAVPPSTLLNFDYYDRYDDFLEADHEIEIARGMKFTLLHDLAAKELEKERSEENMDKQRVSELQKKFDKVISETILGSKKHEEFEDIGSDE